MVMSKQDQFEGKKHVLRTGRQFLVGFSILMITPITWLLVELITANKKTFTYSNDILGMILVSIAIGFFGCIYLIPMAGEMGIKTLSGVDIGKKGLGFPNDGKPIPESMGIVSGTMFILCLLCLQLTPFGRINIINVQAALLSICFAILLGLVDDVMDLKWKHKLLMGVFAAIPLLVAYNDSTSIIIPRQLRFLLMDQETKEPTLINQLISKFGVDINAESLGALVDLHWLYYVYMTMLVVFSTNAVNIYAGVNAIETGQSLVIGFTIAIMNLMELVAQTDMSSNHAQGHLLSFMIMVPFLTSTLGLMYFNWYPASHFVGDVYPYYAGMTFAVAAILGHFSRSLLLFLIPQVFNFIYSAPQLFHFVPIPRHRLPKLNINTGYLEASKVGPNDSRDNFTILCLTLRIFGPLHERTLTQVLMIFQLFCSILGIALRQTLAQVLFQSNK